jgi:ribosomal protein S18 acetylase RimI-like enzyme
MTPKDKPTIMQILQATPEFTIGEVVVAEELVDCYLDDPLSSGYLTFVAEVNSRVVGYICIGPTPLTEGTWDIYWIAVSREEQIRGTGTALLAFAEDKIRESRGRLAFIETSSKTGYDKTRSFYRSRGYELVYQIADFYAPGDDKLILLKRLNPQGNSNL